MTSTRVSPRLDIATKVELLCHYYQDKRPKHRGSFVVDDHPVCDRVGGAFEFKAGKALNTLSNHLVPSANHATKHSNKGLDEQHMHMLTKMEWFSSWVSELQDRRAVDLPKSEPTIEELVGMLVEVCNGVSKPTPNDSHVCTRENGSDFVLRPVRFIERIAPNWFGCPNKRSQLTEALRQNVESLPWFSSWLENSRKRRHVSRMRSMVTKDDKLALIIQFYKGLDPPSWADVIPLSLDDGTEFEFKPATMLDDLINNWLGGSPPGVVLNPDQKAALETLPWVSGWIDRVRSRRLRKRARDVVNASRQSSSSGVSDSSSDFLA